MSHNLNFNDKLGRHAMFSVQQKPWHGLGVVVQDYPTSSEAIRFAGLDYTVNKMPNIQRLSDGTEHVSRNAFFTYRTDTGDVLGEFLGRDYQVVQNLDAFSFFDSIVGGEAGILFETAGALGKGEIIFITAKLPGYIEVGKNDPIEQYLFLTNSFDGTTSIQVGFSPVRIVCNNTLNAALRSNSNKVRIYHTGNVQRDMEEAKKVLGLVNKLPDLYQECFTSMSRAKITDSEVKKLIALAMAPTKEIYAAVSKATDFEQAEISKRFENMTEDVFAYYQSAPEQQGEGLQGTLYGAYNAVTGFYQNVKRYGRASEGEQEQQSKKLRNLLFGRAGQNTQRALSLCEDVLKKGTQSVLN